MTDDRTGRCPPAGLGPRVLPQADGTVQAESLRISNRRMRAHVPESEHFGFGPACLDRLVARYVRTAATERAAR